MAKFLRQGTVATVKLGPFVGPSDGLTPYTAGGFAVKVSANGGALAARHDATAIAHDADGYYPVELDATDTASVGRLKLEVPGSAGNYLPVWDDWTILSGPVYDALFGSAALSTLTAAQAAAAVMSDVTDTVGADVVSILNVVTTTGVKLSVGTGAGQLNVSGGKAPATLAAADVSGNLPANVTQILGTASAGAAGKVALDLAQAVPTSNTAQTVGDALNAARAQGFGAWNITGTTWVIYAGDGVTPVRTFTLNSSTTPTSRA